MRLALVAALIAVLLLPALAAPGVLADLPTLKAFSAQRSSSSDPDWRNGNGDARPIPPGQTVTVADLKGPGTITHIWFTIAAEDRAYPRLLTLRMYWDGETEPSVEAPIGDFFAVGHGLDRYVNSLPVRVTSEGRARNCYWPMPFRKSARIEVTNDGTRPVGALYWYVDWQRGPVAKGAAYFHAQYRQEFPARSGRDYLLLDAVGRGHYVGTVLSVRLAEEGWFGEGDDRFFVDGEAEPSLRGTGSEDYFCDAWGLRPLEGPYYGVPVMEGYQAGDLVTAYRWHIPDPVPFRQSLRVTIEHKGARKQADGSWNGFAERADDFSSVAFWYQVEPHRRFAAVPPGKERLYYDESALIEAETLTPVGETPHQVQQGGGWSGGAQLFFTPKEPARIEIPFTVKEAGEYQLVLLVTRSWDYGDFEAALDGEHLGRTLRLYNPDVIVRDHSLGMVHLSAGEHRLRLDCIGRDPRSQGYYFGLDAILLAPPRTTG